METAPADVSSLGVWSQQSTQPFWWSAAVQQEYQTVRLLAKTLLCNSRSFTACHGGGCWSWCATGSSGKRGAAGLFEGCVHTPARVLWDVHTQEFEAGNFLHLLSVNVRFSAMCLLFCFSAVCGHFFALLCVKVQVVASAICTQCLELWVEMQSWVY